MLKKKKILILVNRDFVLYNFRVELVQRLLSEGYDIHICLPYGPKVKNMVEMGCNFIPISIDGRGMNAIKDINLMRTYNKVFKKLQPDIILTYTTKVCIYAGIVAGKMKIPYLVNISGLGTATEQRGLLQPLMIFLYRRAVKNAQCVFFQNKQNLTFFGEHHMYQGKHQLIPGSGVNLKRWYLMEYPDDSMGVEFLFMARVIKEKGIEYYIAVAETIKGEYPNTVFHVLGPCDGNYRDILASYEEKGIIQYHGEVQDTREYLKKAHCTIHPSYYPEGISNVLIESAACGRPVITTDRSGCRETVEDGVTGYLFQTKNQEQLIACVHKFMRLNNEERRAMGLAGRRKMEREFDRNIVLDAYMEQIKNEL